jgi:hypothetical protein
LKEEKLFHFCKVKHTSNTFPLTLLQQVNQVGLDKHSGDCAKN